MLPDICNICRLATDPTPSLLVVRCLGWFVVVWAMLVAVWTLLSELVWRCSSFLMELMSR
jgi:hypothetical protein